jgi:hypothetical protein
MICLLTYEFRGPDVEAWLMASQGEDLAISAWVITEFSSALSVNMRTGKLSAAQRAGAMTQFGQMRNSLTILPITDSHFHAAALYADRDELGLRAGDALHLAIGSAHGATVVTLDRLMAEAGQAVGIPTILL